MTFVNPDSDPLGAGYHVIQSIIAIGSGGFDRKGIFKGDPDTASISCRNGIRILFFPFLPKNGGFLAAWCCCSFLWP